MKIMTTLNKDSQLKDFPISSEGEKAKILLILKRQRASALSGLHKKQKELDDLDYKIYKIEIDDEEKLK